MPEHSSGCPPRSTSFPRSSAFLRRVGGNHLKAKRVAVLESQTDAPADPRLLLKFSAAWHFAEVGSNQALSFGIIPSP